MDIELQTQLFVNYPRFFRHPGHGLLTELRGIADDRSPFDQFGIQCGNGWFAIINRLSSLCEAYIDILIREGQPEAVWPRVGQIKEKFGGLRFYVDGALPVTIRDEICKAEEKVSYKTCECCGHPGTLRTGNWLHTYCNACEKEYVAKLDRPPAKDMWQKMQQRSCEIRALLGARLE